MIIGLIKKQFRRVQRWPRWLFWPLVWLLRGYLALMRWEVRDPHQLINPRQFPWIGIMWHNRLFFYPLLINAPSRPKIANLVSASRDGQYLADVMTLLKFRVIRGSTRKRAAMALRGALAEVRAGNVAGLSPDGPRGPRYRMSQGPVILASRTGAPVLMLSVNSSSYWTLPSWDRYQIPKPWAKVVLVVSELVKVPPKLDAAGIEHWCRFLETRLNDLSEVPEAERLATTTTLPDEEETA